MSKGMMIQKSGVGVIWLILLWVASSKVFALTPHPLADKVVVLANAEVGDSLTVARRYQETRGIPEENVIILPMSKNGTISRSEFNDQIYNPLLMELVKRGLIDGSILPEKDALGRLQVDVFFCDVDYMVTCMGVPYRIRNTELDDSSVWDAYVVRAQEDHLRYQLPADPFNKNQASVDSELATLALRDVPLNGFILNEDFGKIPADKSSRLVRVTRLDGPSLTNVLGMIGSAIDGEEEGLKGRAYFDQDGRKGAYKEGNDWLEGAERIAEELGFDLSSDQRSAEMDFDDRFDAPAIYFGWYARHVNGVFKLPGFRFPKGAIAAHLHSASASEMRTEDKGWVGPLIHRGVTATFGNVYEPYLSHTHRFDIIMEGLRRGMNWADATYAAVISLSWQSLVIGDPLYKPFKRSVEEQIDQLDSSNDLLGDPYVVIRGINLLEAEGKQSEAKFLGLKYYYRNPSAALALRLAELHQAMNEENSTIVRRLEFAILIDSFEGQDWEVYRRIARMLVEADAAEKAVVIMEHLLADSRIEGNYRKKLLTEGLEWAKKAHAVEPLVEWRQELSEMKANEASKK